MEGLLAAGAGALVLGDVESYNSSAAILDAQSSQLKLESKQSEVAFSQKTLANISQTQKLLGAQEVAASEQGVSSGSSSLKAISLNTFDEGQKKQQNLQTEKAVAEASFKAKQEALSQQKSALPWQALSKVVSQGTSIAGLVA